MSGYFASLMRSSGIPFGGRVVVAPVEPSVAEIDIQNSPVPTAAPHQAPAVSTPLAATVPTPPADPVGPIARPAGRPEQAAAHQERGERAGAERVEPQTPLRAAADPPPVSTVETSRPALNQALVRAAMQWVAADPQQVRGDAQVVPPRGASLPTSGGTVDTAGATQTIHDRDSEALAGPSTVQTIAVVPAVPTRDFLAAQPAPVGTARPVAHVPSAPIVPLTRDEVVEISIGAIHVRVDAPTAQTTARPTTDPPAAAATDTTTRRVRSGLERRALRRI